MFNFFKQVLILTVAFLLLTINFVAQTQPNGEQSVEKGWGVPERPLNCEMNLQSLELVRRLIGGKFNNGEVAIIIARLGNEEKTLKLNHRRLYNVREALNNMLGIPREKVIIAEGEPVKGFGRIEFYLGGVMVGALLVEKNIDICVSCCGPDDRFYPDKKEFNRKYKRGSRKSK